MSNLTYIKHEHIDKKKWDECVLISANGYIYATSAYLDCMTEKWDAIVLGDYDVILPLPTRKKLSINYVYPPAFTQQLGIISKYNIDSNLVRHFLQLVSSKFKYAELILNTTNYTDQYKLTTRKNYLLDIDKDYESIKKKYSRSAIRNINKAKQQKITIQTNILIEEIIKIHRSRFKDKIGVNKNDYKNLITLLNELNKKNQILSIGAINESGEMIAGSIFLMYKNRITFIFNGNSEVALDAGATHLLMDYVIQKFCTHNYIIDFEGSENEKFARFYEQYGAIPESYFFCKINNLPIPIKWLKQ